MKTKISVMGVMLFGFIVLVSNVQAASFDCGKAETKIEKLICDDIELSKLDEELTASYRSALQDAELAAPIKLGQKQWIMERNTCNDVVCLRNAYKERISKLISITGRTTIDINEIDWIGSIAGNYYGGPSIESCVITLPSGKRRCNCLSIKKQSNDTALINFDRHDSHEGYVCSGEGVAKIVNGKLILCNEQSKSDCITISHGSHGLTFHSDAQRSYCGMMGGTVDGMRFQYSDRVQKDVNCGP